MNSEDKNNNFHKITIPGLLIGLLLGIWVSIGIVAYIGSDVLFALGIFGAGFCFLGMIYFYGRSPDKKKVRSLDKEDKKLLSKGSHLWR